MKKHVFLLSVLISSCSRENALNDPVSFYEGYHYWKGKIENSSFPYNVDQVIAGIQAAAAKQDLLVREEEVVDLYHQFELKRAQTNLAEAESLLRSLCGDCIEVAAGKVYYKVLRPGQSGIPLSPNCEGDFIYRVSLLENGTFHEIFSTNETSVRIRLEETIPGFSMGTVGMHNGEKRMLYIHPDLTVGSHPEFLNKLLRIEVSRQ